jgi:Spy/CpxP family protein refolding chaperone
MAMRSYRIWTLALAASAAWAAPAWPADKERLVPEEGAVQVLLLQQKSVRDELKLTENEAAKVREFTMRQWEKAQQANRLGAEERRQRFTEMTRENERFVEQSLTADQRKRLNQITLQLAGLLWVTRPEIATGLRLTDQQKEKARQYQKEARRATEEIIHTPDRELKQGEFRELRMTSRRRLLEILTEEQEDRWKEMTGPPFNGSIRFEAHEGEKP